MKESLEKLASRFESAGQGQIFKFKDQLTDRQVENLLNDAAEIDLHEVEGLVKSLLNEQTVKQGRYEQMEPAPYVSHPKSGGAKEQWREAEAIGENALRAGRVAAFTVAGGQGTRLGYDGPKGTYPATPVSGKPLFHVFAEKIRASEQRYDIQIPWYIMTSPLNHQATMEAFEQANFYGLQKQQLMFFTQGRMPAVDFDGKIMLSGKDAIAMTPDGHGGSMRALVRSGAIADMRDKGIDTISYFQVDNPLVQVIDPAFVGFHLKQDSDMSSKMILKAYPGEKVGHFCIDGQRMCVVEYSDMPTSLQEQTDSNGKLRFISGSIAIHILDVDFAEKIGSGSQDYKLPFHKAVKKIKTIDESGHPVNPEEPNGVKFEMFVFDALPFAGNPVVIETIREDEFSPIKNATGVDSAETCKADQIRQWTRWLRSAGLELATDDSGLPDFEFEISPLFADSEKALVDRWNSLDEKPVIQQGTVLS